MELKGTWKYQDEMEGNGIGSNVEILILDGRKWDWKEPRSLRKQLEGTGNGRNLEISK